MALTMVAALDATEQDLTVLRAVVPLAREAGAALVLLHVVDPRVDAANVLAERRADALKTVIAQRQDYLEGLAHDHSEGLRASIVVEQMERGEDVATALARACRAQEADLVAVASNRASGVRGLILGSITQQVLRLSPCPVLVVRLD